MLLLTLIILENFSETSGKLEYYKPDLSIEMKTYIFRTKVTLSAIYDTVGLMGTHENHVGPIVDFLLKYKNVDAVLISSNVTEFSKAGYVEKTRNLFCFVDTVGDFANMMAFIKATPFFKINGFIQFIVGKPVKDKTWLKDVLRFIWSNGILNYAVIFQIGATIEVIGYNPFDKTVYNFTNHKLGVAIYPDKLRNMHRHKINVGMLHDTPRNNLINGKLVGVDAKRIAEICEKQNATLNLTIYSSSLNLKKGILEGNIDFSTTRFFYYYKSNLVVHPTYPLAFDYLVIIVPTAELLPTYKYLAKVFDNTVWFSLISLTILTIITKHLLSKATKFKYTTSFSESLMAIVQIFLINPYRPMLKAKSSLRILLISWVIYSLLMGIAFNTSLRSSLINPKYKQEIKTLQDLQKSNLKVLINNVTLSDVLDVFARIKPQLLYTNSSVTITKHILNNDKSYAYITYLSAAQQLMRRKDIANRFYFHLLPEYYVGGYSVYNFPEESPYLTKFEETLLLDAQHGLSKFGVEVKLEKVYGLTNKIVMALHHLQSVFVVLAVGTVMSLIAFVSELCYFNALRFLRDYKAP